MGVMILIIHASHTVMRLIILASPTVIIHAIHTVTSLLIIHASHTVIIPASHTDMSQSTIRNQPHPIIKLSSSYISLINLLLHLKEYQLHHNETFYQLLSNY